MGTPASFRGTVTAHPAVRAATFAGTIRGFVAPGFVGPGFVTPPHATFAGTVSRTRVDAYDATTTYVGARVEIDGQEVPQADLVGPVALRETLDSHRASASFQLAGRRWSLYTTEATWTRTPVRIHFRQRQPGGVAVEDLVLDGVVGTCRESHHEGEPVVDVEAGDLTLTYERYRPCYESPPYAGLTRGDHVRAVAATAGFAVDVPDGARYDAPVQVDGPRLFEWLWQWGEPEGWHWRWEGSTLTAYVPALRQPPEPPDHVWTAAEIETLEAEPPQDVPSRWTVSGYGALYVDEVGIETEVTRTTIRGLYAPVGAVERQQADGTRTAVDFTQPEADRVIQELEETVRRRGSVELTRTLRELGWYNLEAAKGKTVLGPGQTGQGWDYTVVYLDAEGRYVYYPVERFGEVGLRTETPSYDAQGTKRSAIERVSRIHRRTHGIRQTGIGEGDPQTAGVGIGGDDQSYLVVTGDLGIEAYGPAEEYRRTFAYHGTTGAALEEKQDEYGWASPAHALDVAGGHRLYDGSAQTDLVAPWIRRRSTVKRNVLSADSRLRGTVEIVSGYRALTKHDGAHDFGGGRSSSESAANFRVLERRNVAYIVRGHNQVEEVTYSDDGERRSRLLLGPLPTPGFLASAWTRLVQEPLELVIDDPVVEAWFGVSSEAISNPYIQSQQEALAVYRARRRRALARKVRVTRAETVARPGDTVLLLFPPLVAERYLLVEVDRTRDPLAGRADAAYLLEAAL